LAIINGGVPGPGRPRKLILFVHGLGGGPGTWGKFGELIDADGTLSDFDYGFHEYPTTVVRIPGSRLSTGIQQLAEGLRTMIGTRYAKYDDIVLVAHSMGGVVARKYIVEQVKARSALPVKAMVLFAVPNEGADIAYWATLISSEHRHLKQLKQDSSFLDDLNSDWHVMKCGSELTVRHVSGGQDRIVPAKSSRAVWAGARLEMIDGKGHGSIVKPVSAADTAFELVRLAALEIDASVGTAQVPASLPVPEASTTEGTHKTMDDGNPLFGIYRTEDEPYYVARSEDGAIEQLVRYRNLWIWGPSGCGKTACATRTLLRQDVPFRLLSLGTAAGGGIKELLAVFDDQLSRIATIGPTPNEEPIEQLVARLDAAAALGIATIVVEEVPLPDPATAQAFFAAVIAVIIRHARSSPGIPVRLVVTSPVDPGGAFGGDSAAGESVTVFRLGQWREEDLAELLRRVDASIPLSLDDTQVRELLRSCDGSPRFIKMFVPNKLTLSSTGEGAFQAALDATREGMAA